MDVQFPRCRNLFLCYGIFGTFFGVIVACGLLFMPTVLLLRVDVFDIKPMMYFGTSYKRAEAVTMSMALVTLFVLGFHIYTMFVDRSRATYTAGVLLSFVAMSALFVGCYFFDIVRTQDAFVKLVNQSSCPWTAHFETPDGERQWGYELADWGPIYEACKEFANNTEKFGSCAGPLFVEKSEKWGNMMLMTFLYFGLCLISLVYFYNRRPSATLKIFLCLSFVLATFGLPIYASTLKTRMPSRMGIDHCVNKRAFTFVLIFSWLTAFAALAFMLLILVQQACFIVIAAILYVGFNCTVVAFWFILQQNHPSCEYPFHQSEFNTMLWLAVPQYFVTLCLCLMIVGMIGSLCCSGDPRWVLVVFYPDGHTEEHPIY